MLVTGHSHVRSIKPMGGAEAKGQYVALLKNGDGVEFSNLAEALAAYGLEIDADGQTARFARHVVTILLVLYQPVARQARCTCGWRGPRRATLMVVASDGMQHEEFHLTQSVRDVLVNNGGQ